MHAYRRLVSGFAVAVIVAGAAGHAVAESYFDGKFLTARDLVADTPAKSGNGPSHQAFALEQPPTTHAALDDLPGAPDMNQPEGKASGFNNLRRKIEDGFNRSAEPPGKGPGDAPRRYARPKSFQIITAGRDRR